MYFNKDCLEVLPTIPDNSVDLIFCDLPYGQTNCKWDSIIDIDKLWIEFKRIRKDTTPIVFTCTTKFGHSLITSNKKEFRMDMVWQKSRKCGFLQARKRPLTGHEMVYFFWMKQPKYNYLKYHKYTKKVSSKETARPNAVYGEIKRDKRIYDKKSGKLLTNYDPPLPASVIKEKVNDEYVDVAKTGKLYGVSGRKTPLRRSKDIMIYEPKLPASVIKEFDEKKGSDIYNKHLLKDRNVGYEPKLPSSVIKEKEDKIPLNNVEGGDKYKNNTGINRTINKNGTRPFVPMKVVGYEPRLPNTVIKEKVNDDAVNDDAVYGEEKRPADRWTKQTYEPRLPDTIMTIASKKPSKHPTGKPLALMEFILKYWTDEGDTVFDPTFGGGSMALQCKIMDRKFIGCEMDKKIYDETMILLNK